MWSRYQLKQAAKDIMSRHYWELFAAALVYGLISSGASSLAGVVSQVASLPAALLNLINIEQSQDVLMSFGAMGGMIAIGTLVGAAVNVFITAPLETGASRYFLESTQERLNFGNLFYAFTSGKYGNIVFVNFLRSLFLFLWSLLLVIPGIVMGYAYSMVPYLLAENPALDYRRALSLSKDMTQGHKWEIFVLELSFIGWFLLGALACGLGTLFVNPYYHSTRAQLYVALRAIALDRGIVTLSELEGRTE